MSIKILNGKFGYENKESVMDLVKNLHEEDLNSTSESKESAYGLNEFQDSHTRSRLLINEKQNNSKSLNSIKKRNTGFARQENIVLRRMRINQQRVKEKK